MPLSLSKITRMDLLASIDSLDGLSSVPFFSSVCFFFQSMTVLDKTIADRKKIPRWTPWSHA